MDTTSFQTLRASAQVVRDEIMLLDDLHRASARRAQGASEHELQVFASRQGGSRWTLLFVMDGEQFAGGVAAGDPQEIARFDLEFDGNQQVAAVNGVSVADFDCDAAVGCPQLVLGSDSVTAPFGSTPGGPSGQTQATGTWAPHDDGAMPGPLTIALDFGGIDTNDYQDHFGNFPTQGFLKAEVLDADGKPPHGVCGNDSTCRMAWNSEHQRFETSAQSSAVLYDLIHHYGASFTEDADDNGVSDLAEREERSDWWRMAHKWDGLVEVGDVQPVVPNFPPEARCADTEPVAVDLDIGDVDAPAQFMMVLDRSGSMKAIANGSSESRLAMVQEAARNELHLHANDTTYDPFKEESDGSPCDDGMDGDGDMDDDLVDSDCRSRTRVGLWTFNHETCVDADGNDTCAELAEIGPDADETPKQDYLDAVDALSPQGYTGIGLAMREVVLELDVLSRQNKALLVLSDGENNRPEGIVCKHPDELAPGEENDEDCHYAVAELLREAGIMVITVPVGHSADAFAMQEIANITSGEMLGAAHPDEVLPIFLHAYALTRGEKPVIAQLPLAVSSVPVLLDIGYTPAQTLEGDEEVTIPVPVESGSQGLNLSLSVREQDSTQWDPEFEVRRPDGTVELTDTDPRVVSQQSSRLVHIDYPVGGQWSVVVRSTHALEKSCFAAHVENPRPGCKVKLSSYEGDGSEPIWATVEASYDTALRHQDVEYSLVLKGIDGSVTEITDFDTSDPEAPASAKIEPSMIPYHGRYEVIATCDVGDLESAVTSSAVIRQGETFGRAVQPIQSPEIPAFRREDRTSLSVVNGDWPPLSNCDNGDCDYDGIPNADEDASDVDGDGVPAAWDDDADGDDVADSEDPDPSDPDVPGQPLPPGCSADSTPPAISAPAVSAEGCVGEVDIEPGVTATDASCPEDGHIEIEGEITAKNGQSLGNPVPVSIDELALPAGSYTLEWTATDVNDNSSTATQSVTVNADASSQALCCPAGSTVYDGDGWPNLFIVPSGQESCVLGRGLWDEIVSGTGADYLSGGANEDSIQTDGADDVVSGGDGSDVLIAAVGPDGTVYGDAGHDVIELTGPGFMSGGSGNDVITGAFGNQTIVPGPGVDGVYAKSGDDLVQIYDVCELAPMEVLEGGSGNDTLITPIPVADMLAMGVIVVGFENVIVSDAERHRSECL